MHSFFVLFGHKILVLLNEFSKPKIWLITKCNFKNQIEYIHDFVEKLDLFFGWAMVVFFSFSCKCMYVTSHATIIILSIYIYINIVKVWEDPDGIDISYLIWFSVLISLSSKSFLWYLELLVFFLNLLLYGYHLRELFVHPVLHFSCFNLLLFVTFL